ncbi:MAG: substrate-binding domain-containing protein [Actinomycetota bacterium]
MRSVWKALFAAVFAVLVGVVVVGCAVPEEQQEQGGGDTGGGQQQEQQGGEQQVAQGGRADLALVTINLEALFFTEMVRGAEKAAEEANASLSVFNANDDPSAQNNAIENYVQQKVDGLMVVAIDVEGIRPALERASEAGIPVVAIDAIVESPAVDVQVGVDNAEAAEQMGEFFNQWAQQEGIDSARIGIVGALNSFIQIQRQDAFEETVKRAGHEIIQVVDGKNQQEEAQRAAENLFTANPDMNAVYATGEPALIGAVAAARSQGATERTSLFGWDLSEQAIGAIDDGFLVGVVQQDPYTEGVRAVESVMRLIEGEDVQENIDVPITIVTEENVDEYRELFE